MQTWTTITLGATSVTTTPGSPAIQNGHIYYVSVVGYTVSGLSATATGSGVEIDQTPPTPGYVYDGSATSGGSPVETYFFGGAQSPPVAVVQWAAFTGSLSGIASYQVGWGTTPGALNLLAMSAPLSAATRTYSAALAANLPDGTQARALEQRSLYENLL